VWRGTDSKGFLCAWIALLERGDYGLLVKLGLSWTWNEADRDSVLAAVPDDLFAAAAQALRGAERV
jgi:hypothetical protein